MALALISKAMSPGLSWLEPRLFTAGLPKQSWHIWSSRRHPFLVILVSSSSSSLTRPHACLLVPFAAIPELTLQAIEQKLAAVIQQHVVVSFFGIHLLTWRVGHRAGVERVRIAVRSTVMFEKGSKQKEDKMAAL